MFGLPGIGAHGDHERGRVADGIAADIEPAIQVVNDVDQADGIHVEDRGGIGIVAHLRRIAGDADQVADADGAGAQQVRLNAQHIAIAAGVMQDGLDADLLLHQQAQRLIAHAGRGARTVGDIDRIHADRLQELRAFQFAFARRCRAEERSPPW